jgi:ribosomal protein S27AE
VEAIMTLLFRACPRCNGDVHERADHYGRYEECLQCGHMRDTQPAFSLNIKIKKGKMKPGRKKSAA